MNLRAAWEVLRAVFYYTLAVAMITFYVLVWTKVIDLGRW